MRLTADSIEGFRFQAALLHGRVLARDDLQLAPDFISKAAEARLRHGLRVIEAYLSRFLILMALFLERGLTPRRGETVKHARGPARGRTRSFRIRLDDRSEPPFEISGSAFERSEPLPGSMGARRIHARPLLEHLSRLKPLIDAPEARARRLAWHLARRRHGVMIAPRGRTVVPARWGTEGSALYDALAVAISRLSHVRPPPLPPPKRAGPRVRML